MLSTGFLGTRADAFVDVAMVVFMAAPFLMAWALRLAAQRSYRAHRRLQVVEGVLLAGIVAVLLLEGSIRFGGAMDAFTVRRVLRHDGDGGPLRGASRRRGFRRSSAGARWPSCRGAAFPASCRAPSACGIGAGAGSPSWACGSPA